MRDTGATQEYNTGGLVQGQPNVVPALNALRYDGGAMAVRALTDMVQASQALIAYPEPQAVKP